MLLLWKSLTRLMNLLSFRIYTALIVVIRCKLAFESEVVKLVNFFYISLD